jgi:hypothetical protein
MHGSSRGLRGPRPWRSGAAGRARTLSLSLAVGLALTGCGPKDPLEIRVRSATELDLDMWRTHAPGRLSQPQIADFNEALQQIKFQIMATGSANGASDVAALAMKTINGQTVRSVLQRGLSWELRSLETEREMRVRALQANAGHVPERGDERAERLRRDVLERQIGEINDQALEITRVARRLDAAGLPTDLPPLTALDLNTPLVPSDPGVGAESAR